MPRWLPVALVLATVACADPPPENMVRVSGHVEATDVRIGPEVGGRIVLLTVKEGDTIKQGSLILRLDATDAQLAIDRAKAEQAHAEAQLRFLQSGSRPEDIRQAEAQADAARDDLAAVRAELKNAEADLQRFEALLAANAGSRKQRDDAMTRRDVARERVQAAESRVRAVEETVGRLRRGPHRSELDAARARVAAAAAQVAVVQETVNDASLYAPIGGVVTQTLAEIGETVPPRAPVVVVTDLEHAWADVFVPEPTVPRIKLGQAATLFTDAGGAGIGGTITFISPKAEFTPRNVQTADERSKLVYRVRISVDNKDGVLKQGMPVEAEIPLTPIAPAS
jgi:HlyD family secretion protein